MRYFSQDAPISMILRPYQLLRKLQPITLLV